MRKQQWLIGFLLVAIGWNLAMGFSTLAKNTQAAQTPAAHLPLVLTPQDTSTSFTVLIDHDTTFVNASVIPGTCRILVTYIDRANGNRLHIAEDMFNRLVEVTLPVSMSLAIGADYLDPQPQFEFPGPKHASGFPLTVCNRTKIYANAREIGDLTGPFRLVRLDMPVPKQPAP